MKNTIQELLIVVDGYAATISAIPEAEFSAKPLSNKWSKKEVLGHLIDSAQNNLRRFICGQYEQSPSKIVYEQDFWVTANGYQEMKKNDVIQLWKLTNHRIAAILSNMATENYRKSTDTGKTSIQLHTLEWLAEDYVKHLKHHLNQIIPNSFNIIYQ